MSCSPDDFERLIMMNLAHNDFGESYSEVEEHIACQLKDKMLVFVRGEVGQIIAYADYFWLKDIEDIQIYEQLGIIPDGIQGRILYVNHCVIESDDKNVVWKLWRKRPPSEYICWKRNDGKIKLWRMHREKTIS